MEFKLSFELILTGGFSMKQIKKNNQHTVFSSIIVASTLAMCSSASLAQTNSNLIKNPSFENSLRDWQQTEPVTNSDHFLDGSRSAKITGNTGALTQTVSVTPYTDYVMEGYIKKSGRIGVTVNGRTTDKRINKSKDWTKAVVEFNSGSADSIEVFATFHNEEGRYDHFFLAPKGSVARSTTAARCPEIGYLPIESVFDDGSNDGNPVINTIDGDLNNRWSSKGIGKTVTFDLGQVVEVSKIDILWYKGADRISLFTIETSIDGNNWLMALPDASSTPMDSYETYDIENMLNPDAKMVRIIGAGNSTSEWNSISEVKIKGCVK